MVKMALHLCVYAKQQKNTTGVLCVPISNQSVQSLDAILIKFNSTFYKANDLLLDSLENSTQDILDVMEKAAKLNREFAQWAVSQPQKWLPTTTRDYAKGRNIDAYFDCKFSTKV